MRTSDDEEASVEDADGRWIPALHKKLDSLVFKDGAAFAHRGRARLEDADSLVPWLSPGDPDETIWMTADADLAMDVSE